MGWKSRSKSTKAAGKLDRELWPSSGDKRAWLVCTAEWALSLPPCHEGRLYASFAVHEFVDLGHGDDALRVLKRIESQPCLTDISALVTAVDTLVHCYLRLGDQDAARRSLLALAVAARTQQRMSSREFGFDRVISTLVTYGAIDSEAAETRKTLAAKDTLVTEALNAGSPLTMPLTMPLKPEATKDVGKSATELRREAEQALASLGPKDWNVHFVASDIVLAVRMLVDEGDTISGGRLLDAVLDRLNNGDFDGRGFASGGAYVDIARAAIVLERISVAKRLLATALEASGPDRRIVANNIADVYCDMQCFQEALTIASKMGGTQRVHTLATIYLRAQRWGELTETLARITDPEIAVKVAWSLAMNMLREK